MAASKAAVSKAAASTAAVKKTPARKVSAPKPKAKDAALAARTTNKKVKAVDAADAQPYLRFYPAKDLHSRLVALLDRIAASADSTPHRAKLSESVVELTAAGLDYYFLQTLKDAKVGFVIHQSANIGLVGVKQVMTPAIRNVVARLDHAQMQAIARSIRAFMK